MTKYDVGVTAKECVAGLAINKNYNFQVTAENLKDATSQAWAKIEEVGGDPLHFNIGKAYEPTAGGNGASAIGNW